MEENNNNKEKFKNETKETVNQVKEAFKGTDFKTEAVNAKNFCLNFLKAPIATVKSIASGEGNNIIIACILLVLLIVFNVLGDAIYYGLNEYLDITAKVVVLDIISPILFIIVFSAATYLLGGKEKKNITTILTAIVVAFTPYIIRDIIYIIYILINQVLSIYFIFNMISLTLGFATMVLLMYTIKALITKTGDEDKDFRRVLFIVFVSYAVVCILNKLEIYSSI